MTIYFYHKWQNPINVQSVCMGGGNTSIRKIVFLFKFLINFYNLFSQILITQYTCPNAQLKTLLEHFTSFCQRLPMLFISHHQHPQNVSFQAMFHMRKQIEITWSKDKLIGSLWDSYCWFWQKIIGCSRLCQRRVQWPPASILF